MFLVLMLLILLIGCVRGDSRLEILLSSGVTFDDNTEVCLILPEVGCGSCIAGGVIFLLDNKDKFLKNQNRNKVVFTAISSMKMLNRALDGIQIDSLNCEIDSLNRYLLPEPDGLYPIVVYVNRGKVTDIEVQNPDGENIFSKLNNRLRDERQ